MEPQFLKISVAAAIIICAKTDNPEYAAALIEGTGGAYILGAKREILTEKKGYLNEGMTSLVTNLTYSVWTDKVSGQVQRIRYANDGGKTHYNQNNEYHTKVLSTEKYTQTWKREDFLSLPAYLEDRTECIVIED